MKNIFSRSMAVRCRRWTWCRIARCKSWRVTQERRHLPRHPSHCRRTWGNDRAPCYALESR